MKTTFWLPKRWLRWLPVCAGLALELANARPHAPVGVEGQPQTAALRMEAKSLALPLRFEPVASEPELPAGFAARGLGYDVRLSADTVRLRLPRQRQPAATEPATPPRSGAKPDPTRGVAEVRLRLVGARAQARLAGGERLDGRVTCICAGGRSPQISLPPMPWMRACRIPMPLW